MPSSTASPSAPTSSLRQLTTDAADPAGRPDGGRRVPDSALAGYLRQARAILTADRPHPDGHRDTAAALPDPFERLRWFQLPDSCLDTTGAD